MQQKSVAVSVTISTVARADMALAIMHGGIDDRLRIDKPLQLRKSAPDNVAAIFI